MRRFWYHRFYTTWANLNDELTFLFGQQRESQNKAKFQIRYLHLYDISTWVDFCFITQRLILKLSVYVKMHFCSDGPVYMHTTSIPICKMPAETNANAASMPPMNIFCSGGISGNRGQAPPGQTGIISSTIAGFITCNWSGISVTPNTSLRSLDAWNVHRDPCY